MMLSRVPRLNCYAKYDSKVSKADNPIINARKAFEKKRMTSLKENFNKLVTIATADSKEVVDFVKELDELHKKEIEKFMDKMPKTVGSSNENESKENIFLDNTTSQ